MKRITFYVEDEMHKQVKLKAVKSSKPVRVILTELIIAWLKK